MQASAGILSKHAFEDFQHVRRCSVLQRYRVKFHRSAVVELAGNARNAFHAARDVGDQQGVLARKGDDTCMRRHHGFERARHLFCGQEPEAYHFVDREIRRVLVEGFEKARGAGAHIGRGDDLENITLVDCGIAVDSE